jgi:hypothetical protein
MTREQALAFHATYTAAYQKLRQDVESSMAAHAVTEAPSGDEVVVPEVPDLVDEGEPPTEEDEALLEALEAEPVMASAKRVKQPKKVLPKRDKKTKSKPIRATKLNGSVHEEKKEEST